MQLRAPASRPQPAEAPVREADLGVGNKPDLHVGVPTIYGPLLRSSKKDHNFLGSILGPLHFCKLSHRDLMEGAGRREVDHSSCLGLGHLKGSSIGLSICT